MRRTLDLPRVETPEQAADYDYLVLSDVHLGSDLVAHVRPWARDSWLGCAPEVDARLVGLLDHYREHAQRAVCLIMAGDFLDLVGVSLPPEERATKTRLTREELRHGLGSAHDHVVQKVRAIAERHRRVFASLCAFLGRGHRLVIVRGNHDVELHWRAAQRALIEAIAEHAPEADRPAIAARVRVCPWFFAVSDLLYVEHGHEFDPMCSYGDPLLPTCPRDSRRIRLSPFAVMLRHIARPTRGLSTRAYENVGFHAYLRLLVRLGLGGSAAIALRFARAVASLLGEWRSRARGERRLRALRALAAQRRFAARSAVASSTLVNLRELYARPAACSLRFVCRCLYLDRMLSFLLALGFVALGAHVSRSRTLWEGAMYTLPAALLAVHACFAADRDLAPTARMRAGAAQIGALFGARYVVMGHTHEAEQSLLANGTTYINVGHWGEDDVPEERSPSEAPALCTYLWLARANGYRAALCRWDSALGPRPHVPEPRPSPCRTGTGGELPQPV